MFYKERAHVVNFLKFSQALCELEINVHQDLKQKKPDTWQTMLASFLKDFKLH